MWREFTRETPARRGLAVIATAILLAGTTALAWVLADQRSRPAGPLRRFGPAGWPVSFATPQEWQPLVTGISDEGEIAWDGSFGVARFQLGDDSAPLAFMIFRFRVVPPGTTLGRAFELLSPDENEADAALLLSEGRETTLAGIPGRRVLLADPAGASRLVAVACSREGLALSVDLLAPAIGLREQRLFESICRAVELQPWFVER